MGASTGTESACPFSTASSTLLIFSSSALRTVSRKTSSASVMFLVASAWLTNSSASASLAFCFWYAVKSDSDCKRTTLRVSEPIATSAWWSRNRRASNASSVSSTPSALSTKRTPELVSLSGLYTTMVRTPLGAVWTPASYSSLNLLNTSTWNCLTANSSMPPRPEYHSR